MFVVMRTAVDYHVPATLDNELNLSVTVERRGRASVEFLQEAWRLDPTTVAGKGTDQVEAPPIRTLIATGRIKVACVDQRTLRPKALPEQVRRFIEGAPMA
jgi:acyl-CoA thioester hydrolase